MRHKWWYWSACAVTIAALSYVLYYYSRIPNPMPVHWNSSGVADNFITKTKASVVFFVVLAPAVVLLIGSIIAWSTEWSARESNNKDESEAKRLAMLNQLGQPIIAHFTFALTTVFAVGIARVIVWGSVAWDFWIILAACLASSVYLVVGMARATQNANTAHPPTHFKAQALKGGIVYWDPNDSRIVIGLNQNGTSVTFNFARLGAWLVMFGLCVPIVLIVMLAIVAR